MINIYNPDGSISMQAFVTKEAKREEELSKSDYISLSFNATVKVVLLMGAYIEHTYYIDRTRSVTQKFMLLEPYTPTQVDEMSWKYTIEFHHPKMQLGKIPFYIKTKNSQNENINQTIWSFVGTPQGMMENVCTFLNSNIKFGKCGWKAILSGAMNNSISVSFSDNDVLSALTAISNAAGDECEWHIDYDDEIIYLGKVAIESAEKFQLSVGKNVGVPSVTESSDGYYNAFAVFGGTRNITQVNDKNENVSSGDIRLQLAKGDGLMVIDGSPVQFSVDEFSVMDLRTDKTLPKFTKVLNFPDIYPSLDTYVYDVRGRKKYVLDPQTNKPIVLRTDEQGNVLEYKTFTVWFMRLAYCTKNKEADKQAVNSTVKDGVTYYWYDFVITDDLKINGKNLSCSFEPNFEEGALSTPLVGRGTNGDNVGFELTYHTKSRTSHESDDCSTGNFNIKQGDYEIIYQEDNNIIIPTNEEQLIIPKGKALPTFECNKVVLYNIAMADVYKVSAQEKLLEAAKKDIILALADTNNYTVKSYPHVFKAQKPRLQIGQSVLLSGKGLRLDTRVLKLSTNLDFDYIQEITVGNKVIKGAVSQLKEDVQSIIANGGGSSSGGGYSVAQFESLVSKYGIKHFLSKKFADVAQEIISFAKGLKLGKEAADNPLGISSDGIATLKEIVSAAFRSGALGSGFKLGDYNGSGDSYLEVDRLLVRKAAEFVRLVIRELQSVGGEIVLSPAAMKISNVVYFEKGVYLPEYEALPLRYNVYRCYFSQKKGDEEIENQFVEGDLVRCQTFNVKEGVSENVKNRYYWRKVYKVGKDFIDVLADFCDTGSDIPQAGDELVQMGNTTDTARQSVVVLSAYGADAPSLKMYEGVDSYSLENKEVFVLSRQEMFAIADKFRFITRKANGEIKSTQSFAELVMSVDGLRTTVNSNKKELDGQIATISSQITQTAGKITTLTNEQTAMGNKISKIEQSTEKISLQVETTTNLKNCIVGSALRPWDDIVKIAAGLSQAVNIINGGGVGGSNYAVFNAQGATANTWTGLYFKDVRVTPGKKYIFSVWVRVIRATDSGAYYTIKRFDNDVAGAVVESKNYPNIVGDWTLYTSQITVHSGCSRLLIETAIRKNGTINLCRLMLMEGTEYGGWSLSPYDKTEAGKLETDLKSTGIDIENGKITATADKFEIRNNSGETTASVNKYGLLMVGAGVFSGLIRKKITEITPENLKKYVTDVPALALGNIQIDFEKTGCFVKFTGNIKAMTKSDVVIVPPFYMPNHTNWGKLSTKTVYEAMAYVGQTIIVVNDSDTEMTTIGYTSMDFDHASKYFGRGQGAMITCVVNKGQNSCTVVWNGRQLPFFYPALESESDPTSTADEPITTTEEEQPKE
ncbi:MAG: Prophage endopeptidase tail [Bacteriophage sp.]|nr:MAG: Prophage endopeptidase tail [Bacteriophage sp.]